jgi:tetratricopeptide (TPR) repeat protein
MKILRRKIALVLVATVGVASAQPAPPSEGDRERALSLFRDSDARYKRGEFEEAAALLRQAYELHPEPILLYNLARAYEGMGELDGAIEQYERYLKLETEIEDRGAIERRIATLKQQVAARTMADNDARPPTPGNSHPVAPPPIVRPPVAGRDHDEARARPRLLPWLIAGGGAVLLGAGAGFGYLSQARHDDAVSEPVQAEAVRLQDAARTDATIANVLFVAGGLTVIGGVTWGLLSRRGDATPPRVAGARIDVGVGSIAVTWTFE